MNGDSYILDTEGLEFEINEIFSAGVLSNISIPEGISIASVYPNPFNPFTNIQFTVEKKANVSIQIYDINGRFIETIVNKKYSSGTYSIKFDANNYASGLYFYRLKSGTEMQVKQLIIIK